MLEEYLQEFMDELSALLPLDWEKTVLYGIVPPGSYEFEVFVRTAQIQEYKYIFDLLERGFLSEEVMTKVFRSLRKICSQAQVSAPEEPWTTFTLSVERSGNFSIDYGYEKDPVDMPEDWEQKYLV